MLPLICGLIGNSAYIYMFRLDRRKPGENTCVRQSCHVPFLRLLTYPTTTDRKFTFRYNAFNEAAILTPKLTNQNCPLSLAIGASLFLILAPTCLNSFWSPKKYNTLTALFKSHEFTYSYDDVNWKD